MATMARVSRVRAWSWPRVVTWGWLPTLLLLVVAVLTVTPVVTALLAGFRDAPPGRAGAISVESIRASFAVMAQPDSWQILWTTVWLSTVRAVLALALAVVLAWIIARTDCPFRNRLEFLLILSFFFPLLGKVLGWALLLSPQKGYLNQLLRQLPFFTGDTGPLDIFSYGGLIFVSVTGWATLLTIFLVPAFRNMDAALEESARMCGASPRRTVLRILVPLLRPAILAAFILSLTRLLSSFETEVFLGTSSGIYVLTNKIYERMVQIFPPDFRTGMTMAVMLLVITFGLVLVNWKFLGKRDYTTVTGRGYSARPMALGRLRWVAFGFVVLFFVVSVVLPAVMLVQVSFIRFIGLDVFDPASYTLDNWRRMLTLRVNRLAVTNSLVMSIVATTVGMIIYSLVSYVVTKSRYKGRRLLDLAAWVPWAVPTLVLGMGILWAVLLSPLAFLYGTLTVMILAHIVRGFPFGTQIMGASMIQISRELEEAARIHKASWTSTFRRIWLPLVKNGFLAGWVIQFTVSFSDLATVAFLYGAKSTVLPTLFLSQWSNGRLEEAAVGALMMTVVVLAVVVLVRRLVQGNVRNPTVA
jgi:iron(III) transport system permease protein